MKDRLQYALYELDAMERVSRMPSPLHCIDARCKLIVTVVFLVSMLSLPLTNLSDILLFCLYPIILSTMGAIGYPKVFRRSLVVLPFVLLIGLFNPIYDRHVMFYIGNLAITDGWITFFSIILRGMLSVQALIVLVDSTGFYNLCRSMQRLGVPSIFTTQLLFVYRYMFVLIQEGVSMSRARDARSFGRRSYPLKVWGMLVGQLLIRTFERAERINKAMLARGFTGRINVDVFNLTRWHSRDTWFLIVWCVVLIVMRIFHPVEMFFAWF